MDHLEDARKIILLLDRKVEDTDFRNYPVLAPAALEYIRSYRGNFSFMLDLKARGAQNSLSISQLRGALNCYRAEINRQEDPKTPSPSNDPFTASSVVDPVVRNGTYTVVFKSPESILYQEDSDYLTLRISTYSKAGRGYPVNTQIAEFLSGPDNENSYTVFALVAGKAIKLFKRYESTGSRMVRALEGLLNSDDPGKFGMAYALVSGNCYICGRKLTVPASLHQGMGPVCASRG